MRSLSPSACFCPPFILCSAEEIAAARRLCSLVIRKGGREGASQQDSLFYIHQKSCLWFAPSLTCDTVDCSTTLLLRKSCTYPLCRRHRPKATAIFPSLLPPIRWCTPHPHPTPRSTRQLQPPLSSRRIHPVFSPPRPGHESLFISQLLLILLLASNHRTFAKVILVENMLHLLLTPPILENRGEMVCSLKAWLTSSKQKNTRRKQRD